MYGNGLLHFAEFCDLLSSNSTQSLEGCVYIRRQSVFFSLVNYTFAIEGTDRHCSDRDSGYSLGGHC